MARRISRDGDDRVAGLTFHNSPSSVRPSGMSFADMQRLFDRVDKSFYLCPECAWRGRGRDLAAMEHDGQEAYAFDASGASWYACPRCEHEIALDSPIMSLVADRSDAGEASEASIVPASSG